jgi:hypothetical protein
MVSVVFFLIIAYRPLIQSLSLNTAERLAGEDFYPVGFLETGMHRDNEQPCPHGTAVLTADHVV